MENAIKLMMIEDITRDKLMAIYVQLASAQLASRDMLMSGGLSKEEAEQKIQAWDAKVRSIVIEASKDK